MDNTATYIRLIGERYPELRIESATLNQEGQYNNVLIVNGDLILRFPKVQAAMESLRRESIVLDRLQPHISLAVPKPVYLCFGSEVAGRTFVGYRMIPGRPLWRDSFRAISDPSALQRLAGQLSGFLRELHHIDAGEVIPIELPIADTAQYWADMYERIRAKLFGHMRPDARRQVGAHFEDYLDCPELYEFEPALRHGDFGTGNILYDPEALSVVGIIDFGGVALGDPAVDFAALRACYGQVFYERCSAVYPEMAQALARVDFYRGTFALQEALFGVENGDDVALRAGMADFV